MYDQWRAKLNLLSTQIYAKKSGSSKAYLVPVSKLISEYLVGASTNM